MTAFLLLCVFHYISHLAPTGSLIDAITGSIGKMKCPQVFRFLWPLSITASFQGQLKTISQGSAQKYMRKILAAKEVGPRCGVVKSQRKRDVLNNLQNENQCVRS